MLPHNSKFFYLLILSGLVIIFSFSYNIYKELTGSASCNESTNFIGGLGGPIELIDQNESFFFVRIKILDFLWFILDIVIALIFVPMI